MDDIKLAMLGNKEAAKRLTDVGCWCRALFDLFAGENVALGVSFTIHREKEASE